MSFRIGDPRLDEAGGDGGDGASRRRHTSAPIPRFGHGSRVPGWDDAVDRT